MVLNHLETFLGSLEANPTAKGFTEYMKDEFYASLLCGTLAHGFLRLGCDTCKHEMLLAFSGKQRDVWPSCAGRRMAQTAAHLVEQVIPSLPAKAPTFPCTYQMAPHLLFHAWSARDASDTEPLRPRRPWRARHTPSDEGCPAL